MSDISVWVMCNRCKINYVDESNSSSYTHGGFTSITHIYTKNSSHSLSTNKRKTDRPAFDVNDDK